MNNELMRLKCVWGDTIEFKGVKLYPIKMKDYEKFSQCIGVISTNKNINPDPQIISMGYLDYIIQVLSVYHKDILDKLDDLLQLVLQEQYYKYSINNNSISLYIYPSIKCLDIVKPIIIDSYDFDDMRKIILKQNLISYDDEIIDADVIQALEKSLEYLNKKNDCGDISEMVTLYCCLSGELESNVKEKTIYQFHKRLNRYIHIENCRYINLLNACERLKETTKIPSLTDHIPEKSKYEDVLISDDKKRELLS